MTLEEAIEIEETKVRSHNEMLASLEKNTLNDMLEVKRSNIEKLMNYHRQLAEWLRELKAYRVLITNADKMIESVYGAVIVEGYSDVFDQMKAIYEEVNADEDRGE